MGKFEIFIIRLLLSVIFAVVASKVFFQNMSYLGMGVIALMLLGLAYLSQSIRKRKKGEGHDA